MSKESEGPLKTLRDRFLKAAIWRNESKKGPFYSVTVERTYKEGDEYRSSHSFQGRDLLAVSQLLVKAYDEILELEAADYEAENPAPGRS